MELSDDAERNNGGIAGTLDQFLRGSENVVQAGVGDGRREEARVGQATNTTKTNGPGPDVVQAGAGNGWKEVVVWHDNTTTHHDQYETNNANHTPIQDGSRMS